jgi:flavin reductase (DIM6/NTAB) family NADH-FMN oxidoreductase RutF
VIDLPNGIHAMATLDPAVLRQRFLLGMSHAACTVSVVTTDGAAGRHGVTVSAMVSVSADTPQPTLLVCIHHLSPVAGALLANGVFCVNVLREDQWPVSDSFAGRSGAHGAAKFDCARWRTQLTGAPRVIEALVAFPANNMTYDGRALVVRPLTTPVEGSRLVLARAAARPLSAMALEFAAHCRSFFGVKHAHADP